MSVSQDLPQPNATNDIPPSHRIPMLPAFTLPLRLPNPVAHLIAHKAPNLLRLPTVHNKPRKNRKQQPAACIRNLRYPSSNSRHKEVAEQDLLTDLLPGNPDHQLHAPQGALLH